jgi:unsaturated rhamnogalacturonyl hydrolase
VATRIGVCSRAATEEEVERSTKAYRAPRRAARGGSRECRTLEIIALKKKYGVFRALIAFIAVALAAATPARAQNSSRQPGGDIYSGENIRLVMERVFRWQVANPVGINERNENLWARAAFYAGVMDAYRATGDGKYLEQATKWAEGRGWRLGDRPRHADDQAPGQPYLDIYLLKKDPAMIAHTRATLDAMARSRRPGREDWWWCDALFMSPPVLARLYTATGDRRYLDFLHAMWWDTTDFLFDAEAGLYYRDENFIGKRNANGKKIFWARGNGWVMGGIVRVLQHLPKGDPRRPRYVGLLKGMAASVGRVQGGDGLWRPSLLDPLEAPVPETSSTGFFCYAIAWGINNGHLDRKTYLPVVRRAWRGLVNSVGEDGKLGWVQRIGFAPDKVSADDNQEYGSGAFLLAGSEMLKLK